MPTPSDPDVRWLVSVCPRDTFERYAYGHTTVVSVANDGFGDVVVAIVTSDVPGRGNAQNLAEYQRDRLRSGLYATSVHTTYDAAWTAVFVTLQRQSEVR